MTYLNENAAGHVDDEPKQKNAHGRDDEPAPKAEAVEPANHFDIHFFDDSAALTLGIKIRKFSKLFIQRAAESTKKVNHFVIADDGPLERC